MKSRLEAILARSPQWLILMIECRAFKAMNRTILDFDFDAIAIGSKVFARALDSERSGAR